MRGLLGHPVVRALRTPVAVSAALGLGLAVGVPVIRQTSYKGVLLLGLIVALVAPLTWLTRTPRRTSEGLEGLGTRLGAFLGVGLLPFAINLVAALLTTQRCELDSGLAMLAVGHAPGLLVAFGVCEALEAYVPRLRRLAFVGVWVGLLVMGAWWFLSQPVYQVAHPLVGMFLGPPNESHEVLVPRTFAFAAEQLAWAAALVAAAAARPVEGAGAAGWRWGAVATAGLALATALTLVAFSPALDYRINTARVEEALRVQSPDDLEEATHFMSPLIPNDARPWLRLEADFQREQQRRLLRLDRDAMPPATLFWFRDEAEKKELTGAARTKFAKVHLGQVYLSADTFPPRTVGHELAHVTSGAFSDTLLRVPGRLGGAWYNPALVEGFAVAVAWDDFPLSAHEQSRVALDKDRLPRLEDLFSPLGFATTNLNVAYRASGSFLRFCMDTWGVEPVLAWYRDEDFEAAFGMPLGRAESRWHNFLRDLPVREQDRGRVENAQSRPSIGEETCGRAEDNLALEAAMRAEADGEVTRLLYRNGDPERDPALWLIRQRYTAQRANYRCDLPPEPTLDLDDADLRRYAFLRALTLWASGRHEDAEALLASLPPSSRDQDDVVAARVMLRDGFSIEDYEPDPAFDPTVQLAVLWDRDHHPVIGYRLALDLWKSQRWRSLDAVITRVDWTHFRFPDDLDGTLRLGTLQMQGIVAFALRDFDRAEAAWRRYIEITNTEGRRAFGQTWLERTRFFKQHRAALTADLPRL